MESEQKRKRLDQPRANKTLLNRRYFLPSIQKGLGAGAGYRALIHSTRIL
jgi:hypothetical protein